MGVIILTLLSPVTGAPTDPFSGSLPNYQTTAPKGTAYGDGDHGVSEQRGAATYSFPITVPPGRLGMQPSLALSYSSQAPNRGGIAAGWSLELPMIEVDSSFGRIATERYKTSLSGSGRLIRVTGDVASFGGLTYRGEHDAGFVRYEKVASPSQWIARGTDGSKHVFGDFDGRRWRLTSTSDGRGNTITYGWSEGVWSSITLYKWRELSWIEYTSNSSAGLAAHARVDFSYKALEQCPSSLVPIGAEVDMHGAVPAWLGARRLLSVATVVKDTPSSTWRPVSKVLLSYDEAELASCDRSAMPLRYLTKIEVEAYPSPPATGIYKAPAVTFTYGPKAQSFATERTIGMSGVRDRGRHGVRAGSTDTLMDIDGDGRQDSVWS